MSRVGECDEEMFPNAWAFWHRAFERSRDSRKGLKALEDVRAALLALPEKRLISRALCTVAKEPVDDRWGDQKELLDQQGAGVCTVGALAWHKRVQSGMSPQEAFDSLPFAPDFDDFGETTVEAGKSAGLSMTVAWWLMDMNDEAFGHLTPEARYEAVLQRVEQKITEHPLREGSVLTSTSATG